MRRLLIGLFVVVGYTPILRTQEYSGVIDMIHVPTAETATEGEARVSFFFLSQEFLPDTHQCEGEKFNTANHFLTITPFPWIEIACVYTILKGIDNDGHVGHDKKDRYFHLRVRPLKEGKWRPAVAIDARDPDSKVNESYAEGKYPVDDYFQNYYITAGKHVVYRRNEFGFHLTYRYFTSDFSVKW